MGDLQKHCNAWVNAGSQNQEFLIIFDFLIIFNFFDFFD